MSQDFFKIFFTYSNTLQREFLKIKLGDWIESAHDKNSLINLCFGESDYWLCSLHFLLYKQGSSLVSITHE